MLWGLGLPSRWLLAAHSMSSTRHHAQAIGRPATSAANRAVSCWNPALPGSRGPSFRRRAVDGNRRRTGTVGALRQLGIAAWRSASRFVATVFRHLVTWVARRTRLISFCLRSVACARHGIRWTLGRPFHADRAFLAGGSARNDSVIRSRMISGPFACPVGPVLRHTGMRWIHPPSLHAPCCPRLD